MSDVNVYLARHGQTAYNLERRFQGQQPVPLDDTGRGQARELAERAADYGFAALWCSPLLTRPRNGRRGRSAHRPGAPRGRALHGDRRGRLDQPAVQRSASQIARAACQVSRRGRELRVPGRRVIRRTGDARGGRAAATWKRARCPRSSSATGWSSAPPCPAVRGTGSRTPSACPTGRSSHLTPPAPCVRRSAAARRPSPADQAALASRSSPRR